MLRISVPYVYNLSEALFPLSSIAHGEKVSDRLYVLYYAHSTLSSFRYQSVWSRCFRVCNSSGGEVLATIKDLIAKNADPEAEFDYFDVVNLSQKVTTFKTVLEAEFQTAATYLVTPRRGYDISTLIENAEVIFPDELMRKVPATMFDLREAGKCLAFNLGTAAGFHLLRALETVIRAYWDVVMDGIPLPDNRNLGNYIREMDRAKKGDAKVLVSLRQIKDHHRNELMHPEEVLNLDQAIALLGITQSAVVAMLREIPEPLTFAESDPLQLTPPEESV